MSAPRGTYVYFIKPIGMQGPIKIGCSYSPDNRCATLATWAPFALEIIAKIGGDIATERRFHAAFAHLHERREWFSWGADLQAAIDQVISGEFDLDSLPAPRCITSFAGGRSKGWTPLQKSRASLNKRVTNMLRRTGHACPINAYQAATNQDAEALAAVHRFLADPIAHGRPINAPWAKERAAEYTKAKAA